MIAALFTLLVAEGCGDGASVAAPSNEVARAALDASLKAWVDGGKPGTLAGTDPVVQAHDTHWSQGETLVGYEILEETAGAAEKQFSVRLSLAKPERTEDVQYYVLGLGPVMVFRDEDYQRNINMENGPRTSKAGGASQRRKGGSSPN